MVPSGDAYIQLLVGLGRSDDGGRLGRSARSGVISTVWRVIRAFGRVTLQRKDICLLLASLRPWFGWEVSADAPGKGVISWRRLTDRSRNRPLLETPWTNTG